MTRDIPDALSVLVRTYYGDDAAWTSLLVETLTEGSDLADPAAFSPFTAVDDRSFEGATAKELVELAQSHSSSYIVVADQTALSDSEHPVLVVDLSDPSAVSPATFRVVSAQFQNVESNLSIANVDFDEFRSAADTDEVFRGFRRETEERFVTEQQILDAIPAGAESETLHQLRVDLQEQFRVYPDSALVQLAAMKINDLTTRQQDLVDSTFPFGATPLGYNEMVGVCAGGGAAWGLHLPMTHHYWSVILDIDTLAPRVAMRVDMAAR